jgi:fructose-specific phosphotransferase system IIC component
MEGGYSSLLEFFQWIFQGGGAMILAGFVVAYLLENLGWWHDLPHWVKLVVPIILAGVFGVLAESLVVVGLLDQIPPVVQSIVLMLINWLFSQLAYKGIKEGAYAESARGP